ncbi:hypothetical protein WA026_008726 [Henosepilachna vigintioctopunctata]|uniref:Copper type II ascorbate-dependent monooxygenase N-terminal domain-containing protein n=1 Tax=Henosepilachna vigintioctopunctata TaxID=420089 RepID=A0AAW1V2K9_9CUCU
MDKIHHMILFGCTTPGTDDPYWDCGEMSTTNTNNLKESPPCSSGTHVIFAWARNANALTLPEGVGFQVGENTAIRYLVIQIHYSHKLPENELDSSGLTLVYTQTPLVLYTIFLAHIFQFKLVQFKEASWCSSVGNRWINSSTRSDSY